MPFFDPAGFLQHHALWKGLHMAVAALSVGLFFVRALAVQFGQRWPLSRRLENFSIVVDSALLLLGASLWHALQLNPWDHPWLGVKLCLLLLYIGAGSIALRRGRTPAHRWAALVLAALFIGLLLRVALTRQLGF